MSEWIKTSLGDTISFSSGESLPKQNWEPGSVPVYGGNGISGYHSKSNINTIRLIIGRVGEHCGNAYITEEQSWVTDNALITSFKGEIHSLDFWQYLLSSLELRKQAYSSAQPVITGGILNRINVCLPPYEQQQKIAKILSTVDNLIEKTQTLIDKYTAIKQGMMADLFTRGIDMTSGDTPNSKGGKLRPSVEDAPELYKQTELGWMPKEWEVKSVGEIAEVTKLAGFEFTQYFNYAEGGEIIALRAMNVKNEKIDITNVQKIGKSVSDKLPRSKLHVGDIVFTYIGAYIGDAAIIDENDKYHLAPNICLIRPLQSKSAFFLFKQLRSEPLYRQMMSKTVTTATPSLTMTQIRTLKLSWPPINEQLEIESRLRSIDDKMDILVIDLNKKKELKKGLMQDLLTGKVKVN